MNQNQIVTSNIDELVEVIIPNIIKSSENLVIGIDGRSGSGKTTLANKLLSKFPKCKSVGLDEFHFPKDNTSGKDYNYKRLIDEVILPFKNKIFPIKYQRYNFGADKGLDFDGLDEWITIENTKMLLVEGFSVSSLADVLNILIWVESNPIISIERAIKRNVDQYGLKEISTREKKEWAKNQEKWIIQNKPMKIADIIFKN